MWTLFELYLIILCIFCISHEVPQQEFYNFVQEIEYGKIAKLICRSNNGDYNFMFWEFGNGIIIGPGNQYNKSKYEYEVLSGDLYLIDVSLEEEGLYRCLSRGVRLHDWQVKITKIIVKNISKDTFGSDTVSNCEIIIGISSLFIITGGAYLLYSNWKQKRNPYHHTYLKTTEDEDSSGEDLFLEFTKQSHSNANSRLNAPFVQIKR